MQLTPMGHLMIQLSPLFAMRSKKKVGIPFPSNAVNGRVCIGAGSITVVVALGLRSRLRFPTPAIFCALLVLLLMPDDGLISVMVVVVTS